MSGYKVKEGDGELLRMIMRAVIVVIRRPKMLIGAINFFCHCHFVLGSQLVGESLNI